MRLVYQPDLFPASFRNHLPRWLACSDDLGATVHLPRDEAMAMPYIAPNARALVWADVFDIDRPGAAVDWDDGTKPPPNWTAENPANGHAHLGYILLHPVPRTPTARARPLRALARVEAGLTTLLGADRAYSHVLTKTPLHPAWRTLWPRPEPYTLDELRDYLPDNLPLTLPRNEAVGVGRNVCLFDSLRQWAYRNRRHYTDWPAWLSACQRHAGGINGYTPPLPLGEVHDTAKSVAKWVWSGGRGADFSPAGFARVQTARGRASGTRSAAARMDRVAQLLNMEELPCR